MDFLTHLKSFMNEDEANKLYDSLLEIFITIPV